MIESVQNKVVYRCGEEVSFPFPYRFFDKNDICVFLADSSSGENGRQLVYGEEFSIDNKESYQNGAVVTLKLDPGSIKDKYLAIIRLLPVTQTTSLPERGKLPSKALEDQLDKIVMIMQQQQEEIDRCARVPVYSTTDPLHYLEDLVSVTVNSKDVALNAADAAAHSALTASISERNVSLIWAELTGDPSLAENALLTVKEAAEATGAIKTAKEIAIGEINGVGSMAIASTQKAADEALEAAKQATDSAGSITQKVDDAITIQVSQAVGADGVLGVAVAAGIADVEAARQQALDRANETLSQIKNSSAEFETAKNQGITEINLKVNGVALDVETALARAQIIADKYLADAKATVSGSLSDLEKMKEEATAAGNTQLLEYINKRIEELNTLQGYLTDAEAAAGAAENFKSQAQGLVNGFTVTVDGALADIDNAKSAAVTAVSGKVSEANTAASNALSRAQEAAGYAGNASTSASNALKSAQDAATSASNANAAALAAGAAAGEAAQTAAAQSITAHNSNSNAHSDLFSQKLSLSGGTMTGKIILSGSGGSTEIKRDSTNSFTVIRGGTTYTDGASVYINGNSATDTSSIGGVGAVCLRATDNASWSDVIIKPDGVFTCKNKNIVRSVDGVNADAAGNVALNALPKSGGQLTGAVIARSVNNSFLQLRGGAKGTGYEADLVLYGDEYGSETYKGGFELRAGKGEASKYLALQGFRDRTLRWDGKEVVCVSSWKASDGSSWYRKYSDGWVEQGGSFTGTGYTTGFPLTFPVEFADVTYQFFAQCYRESKGYGANTATIVIGTKTTTGGTVTSSRVGAESAIAYKDTVDWYACGFAK